VKIFDKKDEVTLFLLRNTSLVALIFLVIAFSVLVPNFTDSLNLTAIMSQSMVTGFLALGQLLAILTGGIDLSQGSLVALTSIVVSVTMRSFGLASAIFAGIGTGLFIGAVNGFLVSKTKMPAFIVTLGVMGIARGMALMLANAKPVPIDNEYYKILGAGRISWIPISSILLLTASIVIHYFLTHRRSGRYIYAIGSNENNSLLSGINVPRMKLTVYILSSFLCAIGGMIWCSRLVSGSPVGGINYETESIAAVIVGGASLSGGEGSVLGTMAGVFIFQCIASMLNLTGVNPFWQGVFKGILIVGAVILSVFRNQGTKDKKA
jgi:ribose transport system permease protein